MHSSELIHVTKEKIADVPQEEILLDNDPRIIKERTQKLTIKLLKYFEKFKDSNERKLAYEKLYSIVFNGDEVSFLLQLRLGDEFSPSSEKLTEELRKKVIFSSLSDESIIKQVFGLGSLKDLATLSTRYTSELSLEYLPIYSVTEETTGNSYAVGSELINPHSFLLTKQFIASLHTNTYLESEDSHESVLALILQAKLFGYFDPEQPNSTYYRKIITPYISEDDAPVFRELRLEEKDSERLELLKKTWHAIFIKYWVSLSRKDQVPSVPLNRTSKLQADEKLPPHMSAMFIQSKQAVVSHQYDRTAELRANTLDQSNFLAQNMELQRHLVKLIHAYSENKSIDNKYLKLLFTHQLCHKIFNEVTQSLHAVPPEQIDQANLQRLAERVENILPKIESSSASKEVFGESWTTISPIEKVCLVTFVAFVSNGQLMQGTQQIVAIIQDKLLPILQKQSDVQGAPELLEDSSLEDYSNERYQFEKQAALARLEHYSINKDFITNTTDTEVIEILNARELAIQEFNKLTKLAWTRENYIRLKQLVGGEYIDIAIKVGLFAGQIVAALGFGAAVASDALGLYKMGAAEMFIAQFGGICSSLILKNLVTSQRFLPKALAKKQPFDTFSQTISPTVGEVKKQYQNEIKKMVRFYILFTVISLLLASAGAEYFDPTAEATTGTGEKTEIKGVTGTIREAFRGGKDFLIEKFTDTEIKEDYKDVPKFYVYGNQNETLFWIADMFGHLKAAMPDMFYTLVDKDTRQQVDMSTNLSEFYTLVQTAAAQKDHIVRVNTDRPFQRFESPQGYVPVKVLGYDPSSENEYFSVQDGFNYLEVTGTGPIRVSKDALFAVIYRKQEQPFMVLSAEANILKKDLNHPLPPEALQTGELSAFAQLIEAHRNSRPESEKLSAKDFLFKAVEVLSTKGIVVGSGDTTADLGAKTKTEYLNILLGKKEKQSGKMILNPDQINALIYELATTAGIPIVFREGYIDTADSRYGGYSGTFQSRLLYENDDGTWEFFEPTTSLLHVGSTEELQVIDEKDPLAERIEAEQKRRQLITAAIVGVMLAAGGASAQLLRNRKMGHKIANFTSEIQSSRKKIQKELEACDLDSQLAAWGLIMSILGIVDINLAEPEKTKQVTGWYSFHYTQEQPDGKMSGHLTPSSENAQRIVSDLFQKVLNPTSHAEIAKTATRKVDKVIEQYEESGRDVLKSNIFLTAVCRNYFQQLFNKDQSTIDKQFTKIHEGLALVLAAINAKLPEITSDADRDRILKVRVVLLKLKESFISID